MTWGGRHALWLTLAIATGCGGAQATPTESAPRTAATTCFRGEYRGVPTGDRAASPEEMQAIRQIVENRLSAIGASGSGVTMDGADRIVVTVPCGGAASAEVRKVVSGTGRVEFVPLPPGTTDVQAGTRLGPDLPGCPADLSVIAVACVLFGGDQIDTVSAGFDGTGQHAVDFTLKADGAALFDDYARSAFAGVNAVANGQFAIVLDGVVVTAPTVNARSFDGKGQIAGAFASDAEVNDFVALLKFGPLPLRLQELSVN